MQISNCNKCDLSQKYFPIFWCLKMKLKDLSWEYDVKQCETYGTRQGAKQQVYQEKECLDIMCLFSFAFGVYDEIFSCTFFWHFRNEKTVSARQITLCTPLDYLIRK